MAEQHMDGAGHRAIIRFASGKQVVLWLPTTDQVQAFTEVQRQLRYDEPDMVSVRVERVQP